MLPDPLNMLYASEQSASATQHSPQATTKLPESSGMQDTPAKPRKQKRKLSAFFKVGIALNITMIVTFIWWASRQWRMTTRNKDS